MKVAEATWKEVEGFSREGVVVIPTGSLEQHGPHLPLITDTLIVTAVAEAVESRLPDSVLLLPTLWMGASGHHLGYPGSVSSSMAGYLAAIADLVACYERHHFRKFVLLNGHGGNVELNHLALRQLKLENPNQVFADFSYYGLITEELTQTLTGPLKGMRHACEAETSLVMHLRPDLVRADALRDDGMKPEPDIAGLVLDFQELSDEGSIGYATLGAPEKGRFLFEAAVSKVQTNLERLASGFVLIPIQE